MLPPNAFLRRIPTVVNPKEVVELEAIVFSSDAVEFSMGAIKRVTAEHREKLALAKPDVRVGLFVHTWTIVDCLHTVRQMLKALDYGTPQANTFYDRYECASLLRNKMDHLKGIAANVASSKGRPPVFGTLSYICVPETNIMNSDGQIALTGAGLMILTSGRFNISGGKFGMVNPADCTITGPVGCFRFEAFEYTLTLDDAEHDLREIVTEMNGKLEANAIAQGTAVSNERNVPIERVLANPAGAMTLFMPFTFENTT